jgi:hypothetical protein
MWNTLTFASNLSAKHFRVTDTQAQPLIEDVLSPTREPICI